jgi:hypothetical protein
MRAAVDTVKSFAAHLAAQDDLEIRLSDVHGCREDIGR